MHLKFAEMLAIVVHENMHKSWRLNNKKLKGHIQVICDVIAGAWGKKF